MSRRHRQRSRNLAGAISRQVRIGLGSIAADPMRAGLLAVLGLALSWVVLTKSLPYALAPVAPDTALALNPDNPAALIAKAEQLRGELLALSGVTGERTASQEEKPANTIAQLPEAKDAEGRDASGIREALQGKIRELAARAIASDPLNAAAYRLLAEAGSQPDQVRSLMLEAYRRSRRETVALFWLLNDSYYRKDFQAALDYAGVLLRTRPQLAAYGQGYLVLIAEDPEGRPLLVRQLAANPAWRAQFFQVLPRRTERVDLPLELMTALAGAGSPETAKELAPYLDALIGRNLTDLAYNAWLQFLPEAQRANPGLLANGSFENVPSGLPFDWRITRGANAVAEIVPLNGADGKLALHVSFGTGRVRFPEVSYAVLLQPGRYRLEGKLRGTVTAKRGLRWQLRCAAGGRRMLGETEMLLGQSQQWRVFTLEAEVPPPEDCNGQTLRLFHDARSASEELISGEIWFDDLRLERVPEQDVAAQK